MHRWMITAHLEVPEMQFHGQEHIDDLGLNCDSFKCRNHQPDIGRFFNIDPLAERYVYNSPYAFSGNKVVAHRELEGLEAEPIVEQVIVLERAEPLVEEESPIKIISSGRKV